MNRKHRSIVAGGVLASLIVFVLGSSWSNTSGQSKAEWWQDVAEIRDMANMLDKPTGGQQADLGHPRKDGEEVAFPAATVCV